jgi:phosphopentomutase
LLSDTRFIFANFEDFDMLYGHRSDPVGFAKALEAFDIFLGDFLKQLKPDDLVLFTADHGNDPTDVSTDHTREYAPVCMVKAGLPGCSYGDLDGFMQIADAIEEHLTGTSASGKAKLLLSH